MSQWICVRKGSRLQVWRTHTKLSIVSSVPKQPYVEGQKQVSINLDIKDDPPSWQSVKRGIAYPAGVRRPASSRRDQRSS